MPVKREIIGSYTVYADDNFWFMGEDARRTVGHFATAGEALDACLRLIGSHMLQADHAAKDASDLYDHYTSFADDPFIKGEPRVNFSAWNYAEGLAGQLAGVADCHGPEVERRWREGFHRGFLAGLGNGRES